MCVCVTSHATKSIHPAHQQQHEDGLPPLRRASQAEGTHTHTQKQDTFQGRLYMLRISFNLTNGVISLAHGRNGLRYTARQSVIYIAYSRVMALHMGTRGGAGDIQPCRLRTKYSDANPKCRRIQSDLCSIQIDCVRCGGQTVIARAFHPPRLAPRISGKRVRRANGERERAKERKANKSDDRLAHFRRCVCQRVICMTEKRAKSLGCRGCHTRGCPQLAQLALVVCVCV